MSDQNEVDRSGWVVNLQGKQFATWPYVLDESHQRGLVGIDCELVQIPSDDNGQVAIVKATATFKTESGEKVFRAYGDASPKNVNAKIATALIRMSETRAKGRALRDACNIGMTLAEELGDDGPAPPQQSAPPRTSTRNDAPPPDDNEEPASKPVGGNCCKCGRSMTPGQVEFCKRKFGGELLCSLHQPQAGKGG